MKNLKIHPAKPSDWPIIQKLNHEVFIDNAQYDQYEQVDWPLSEEGIDYYKQATTQKKYCCLIAEVDKQPVGYLIGIAKDFNYRVNKTAEIENMGVSPNFRSKGIGAKLISRFAQWAKARGFTHIFVDAYYQNSQAIKFYQKQGLNPFGLSLEGKI